MSWAWPQLQKSGPAKTGPAGPLATALYIESATTLFDYYIDDEETQEFPVIVSQKKWTFRA